MLVDTLKARGRLGHSKMVSAPYERKKRENNINCRSCRRDLYLEINIADLRKVFACTVTYIYVPIYIYVTGSAKTCQISHCLEIDFFDIFRKNNKP